MTLNLDTLASKAKTTALPKSTRGRKAEPISDAVLALVKDSYSLPAGEGMQIPVPNGDKDDKGRDLNVVSVFATLRRAATAQGLGISISAQEPTKTTTTVVFRATDKRIVNRTSKADQGYIRGEDGKYLSDDAMVAEGYSWDDAQSAWIIGELPDGE